jgi:hypothetical protein
VLFQREIVLFQRCVKEESGMQKQQGSRNGLVNRARKERKNTEGEGKKKDLDKKKGLGQKTDLSKKKKTLKKKKKKKKKQTKKKKKKIEKEIKPVWLFENQKSSFKNKKNKFF